jgi:hypothetical protein
MGIISKAWKGIKKILPGAVSGAAAGSSFGPVGTVAGAVIGGTGAALAKDSKGKGGSGGIFGSKKDQTLQMSNLLPEQKDLLLNQIDQLQGGPTGQNYGLAQGYLQSLLSNDPNTYNQFAAPYLAQYNQETLPMLQERFAGMGGPMGGGLGSSSGFAQALGASGSRLNADLAGLYANLRQNAANQAFSNYGAQSNMALATRAFQPSFQPGQPGLGASIIGSSASGLADILTKQLGQSLSDKIAGAFKKTPQAGKQTGIA